MSAETPYREFAPDPRLRQFVECYWFSKISVNQNGFRAILPDACSDFIFNFGAPIIYKGSLQATVNDHRAFYVGIQTKPSYTSVDGVTDLFAVRFRNEGAWALLRRPMHEFVDGVVALRDLEEHEMDGLAEAMAEATTLSRISLLESALLKRLANTTCDYLTARLGQNLLADIAGASRHLGVSTRSLERKIADRTGLSPKKYLRLARFRRAVNELPGHRGSLMEFAWDMGYYDHAHLVKEFRELGHCLPSKFVL